MKKIKFYHETPKECCRCRFYQVGCYGIGHCILDEDMRDVRYPDFDIPEWCPLNNAEECEG